MGLVGGLKLIHLEFSLRCRIAGFIFTSLALHRWVSWRNLLRQQASFNENVLRTCSICLACLGKCSKVIITWTSIEREANNNKITNMGRQKNCLWCLKTCSPLSHNSFFFGSWQKPTHFVVDLSFLNCLIRDLVSFID